MDATNKGDGAARHAKLRNAPKSFVDLMRTQSQTMGKFRHVSASIVNSTLHLLIDILYRNYQPTAVQHIVVGLQEAVLKDPLCNWKWLWCVECTHNGPQ